jgi:hypothetical protein
MHRLRYLVLFFPVVLALTFSSCGPGQLFGPTITPSPTPIPGIHVPITVNGMDVQIEAAIVGAGLPAGYGLTDESATPLSIEIIFSAEDIGDLWKDVVVVDENRNETHAGLYTREFSANDTESASQKFIFGVSKDAKSFILRFPDGQEIDLTPILEFK